MQIEIQRSAMQIDETHTNLEHLRGCSLSMAVVRLGTWRTLRICTTPIDARSTSLLVWREFLR